MTARQLPSPVGKFETFMTATNQLAELDSLRSQLDEAKLRLKATRTEVAKLDQVGGGDPPPLSQPSGSGFRTCWTGSRPDQCCESELNSMYLDPQHWA